MIFPDGRKMNLPDPVSRLLLGTPFAASNVGGADAVVNVLSMYIMEFHLSNYSICSVGPSEVGKL